MYLTLCVLYSLKLLIYFFPSSPGMAEGIQRSMSVTPAAAANKEAPGFQRSLSQPGQEELPESIWNVTPATTTAAAGKTTCYIDKN